MPKWAEHVVRQPFSGHHRGRPTIILVPPIFDEANKVRRTLLITLRALAQHGFAVALPDLPGQNDSLVETSSVDISHWRQSLRDFSKTIDGDIATASWRGGSLIDDAAPAIAHWRMSPVCGSTLLKSLLRGKLASLKEAGRSMTMAQLRAEALSNGAELAGHRLSSSMIAQLENAIPSEPHHLRVVEPQSPGIGGSALWLRSEPTEDAQMAQAMANDISAWVQSCVDD